MPSAPEHDHPIHNGIPPPPPSMSGAPEHSFVHSVEGVAPPHLEAHGPEPAHHEMHIADQRIQQLKQKTDRDIQALICKI